MKVGGSGGPSGAGAKEAGAGEGELPDELSAEEAKKYSPEWLKEHGYVQQEDGSWKKEESEEPGAIQ